MMFAIALVAATAVAPSAAEPQSSMDFVGRSVDFRAAADAEALTTPTKGYTLSAGFGQSGSRWSSGRHTGLDFAAPVGTPVLAADGGKVVKAGSEGAYGNFVEIAHGNGARTRYAHLSSISVDKGQVVQAGQRLGGLGSTGNSTGPHLHFEVLRDGKQVDPALHLDL